MYVLYKASPQTFDQFLGEKSQIFNSTKER